MDNVIHYLLVSYLLSRSGHLFIYGEFAEQVNVPVSPSLLYCYWCYFLL